MWRSLLRGLQSEIRSSHGYYSDQSWYPWLWTWCSWGELWALNFAGVRFLLKVFTKKKNKVKFIYDVLVHVLLFACVPLPRLESGLSPNKFRALVWWCSPSQKSTSYCYSHHVYSLQRALVTAFMHRFQNDPVISWVYTDCTGIFSKIHRNWLFNWWV